MFRARFIIVGVLLVSYGAVGARQPAVRSQAPLPAPAAAIAEALGLPSAERGHILLDVIRLVYDTPEGADPDDVRLRLQLRQLLSSPQLPGERVPLPLDPSIWRETLLRRQVTDAQIVEAILSNRQLALLYYGLAALDDETLAWLGPDRDTLSHLLRHSSVFATFGRSVRVKAGRIVVPGGQDMEAIWEAVVGASAARPGAFVRRLFSGRGAPLAFFYDTIAHLDEPRLRFALAAGLPPGERLDRVRALASAFQQAAGDLRIDARPFSRPIFDASLTLSLLTVSNSGQPVGPTARWFWDSVFSGDHDRYVSFHDVPVGPATGGDPRQIDAAWLVARIHRDGPVTGRRRLDAVLFTQRVFPGSDGREPGLATAVRGFLAFPALMLTLERAGIDAPQIMAAAAARADQLNGIRNEGARHLAIVQFQAAVGIVERIARMEGLDRTRVRLLVSSLLSMPPSDRGYEGRFESWLQQHLLASLPATDRGASESMDTALLSAMAGVKGPATDPPVIEWEGRTYTVNTGRAELHRLQRVRERLGGKSLDQALGGAHGAAASAQDRRQGAVELAETLQSILYAASLGDPEGRALAAGNVALRHELWKTDGLARRAAAAWQLPSESFGGQDSWRLTGSLLGLDVALGRLALRRLDANVMPSAPRLASTEQQTAFLTVALMNPSRLTDAARDEIAAALARGRARLDALTGDREEIERAARAAGLSEWRREALAWTVAHDRERVSSQLSLVELFWLGGPRASDAVAFDPWGTAALPVTGCLCLEMPRAQPWEHLAGRPAVGLLATRGADLALHVAETLASLRMPAVLAPGVMAFAMREMIDVAQPAHFDDWVEITRAAQRVPPDRLADFVAALAAEGPLLPRAAASHQR